jgi:hypothetical protein
VTVGTGGGQGLGGNNTACGMTGSDCGIAGDQGAVIQFP